MPFDSTQSLVSAQNFTRPPKRLATATSPARFTDVREGSPLPPGRVM
jgi:hypothetical protein